MEYQFSFDKKRLFLLCLALVLVGALTFACGVVTGIGLWKSHGVPAAAASTANIKGNPLAQLGSAKSALKLPALPKAPAPPAVPGAPAVIALATAAASTPAPAPAPAPPAATAPAVAAPAPAVAPAAAPVAALPAAAAVAAAPNPADQPYVLQLGAFREQKNAKLLQAELTKKGYATIICNMVDEDQRTWHMVRFGGYKDLNTASQAASDFTGKEGIQAFVRRSDSL